MMNDDDVVAARASGRETVEELRRSGAWMRCLSVLMLARWRWTGSEGLLPACSRRRWSAGWPLS